MTTTGGAASVYEFEKAFSLTKYRGPDDTRIIDIERMTEISGRFSEIEITPPCRKGIMGFHRLSIMGLTPEGMQPFIRKGCAVICNGELYGFEKTKKELVAPCGQLLCLRILCHAGPGRSRKSMGFSAFTHHCRS